MIRLADDQDIPFIQSILNAPENLSKREAYSDDQIRASLRSPENTLWIWCEDAAPKGFCWLCQTTQGTKIEEFGVTSPGNGTGTRFFDAILLQIQSAHPSTPIWLNVAADNDAAIRFYQRFGFVADQVTKAVWNRRVGPVADAVKMVRPSDRKRPGNTDAA